MIFTKFSLKTIFTLPSSLSLLMMAVGRKPSDKCSTKISFAFRPGISLPEILCSFSATLLCFSISAFATSCKIRFISFIVPAQSTSSTSLTSIIPLKALSSNLSEPSLDIPLGSRSISLINGTSWEKFFSSANASSSPVNSSKAVLKLCLTGIGTPRSISIVSSINLDLLSALFDVFTAMPPATSIGTSERRTFFSSAICFKRLLKRGAAIFSKNDTTALTLPSVISIKRTGSTSSSDPAEDNSFSRSITSPGNLPFARISSHHPSCSSFELTAIFSLPSS